MVTRTDATIGSFDGAKICKVVGLVPHPDVFWYHLNGMGAQKNTPKKVLLTLIPYIFHLKTK